MLVITPLILLQKYLTKDCYTQGTLGQKEKLLYVCNQNIHQLKISGNVTINVK